MESSETVINHFLPELSNAPEAIVAASPDYWHPKVTAKAAKPKVPAVNSSETDKMEEKK